jgi:Flp pilus assembly protein TadG
MFSSLKRFWSDRRGQFSIVSIAAMPLIMTATGIALDLTNQQRFDSELQNAVDAGALAGAAIAYEGASQEQIRERVRTFFLPVCQVPNCSTAMTLSTTFSADRLTVTASGSVRPPFLSIFGRESMPIEAKAQVTLKSTPSHYEVHMVLDNTGSMNIIDGLSNIRAFRTQFNPWGSSSCAFACHDRGGDGRGGDGGVAWQGETGAEMARRIGYPMREDRLRAEMIDQARILLSGGSSSRVKIATYDFDWWVHRRTAPTSIFNDVRRSIEGMAWHSPGTNHGWFAAELARLVGVSGDGLTAANPRKAIVMITDGVSQINGSNELQPVQQATCDLLKQDGREVFILNMVYPNPAEIGSMDANLTRKITDLHPRLEPALQACASPGKYFRAEYGATIDQALESIRIAIERDARQMYLAM